MARTPRLFGTHEPGIAGDQGYLMMPDGADLGVTIAKDLIAS